MSRTTAEERHARSLYQRLMKIYFGRSPETTIDLQGAGVHWQCTAHCGLLCCTVNCFHNAGVEYFTLFEDDTGTMASGRTPSQDDTVAAVRAWLSGRSVQEMYAEFDFVDQGLRALMEIAWRATELYPQLSGTLRKDRQFYSAHELWFLSPQRSCRLYFYGEDTHPTAEFHWDECQLFVVETNEVETLALIMKRWLCDDVMPSVLRKEFPWMQISPVADAYEQGRGIEGEFMASWDSIVTFYEEDRHSFTDGALGLIARMRESGFDRTLRAGQSMYALLLSRSRRHGLRNEQPRIAFDFHTSGMTIHTYFDGEMETTTVSDFDYTPEIMALLERLEDTPID